MVGGVRVRPGDNPRVRVDKNGSNSREMPPDSGGILRGCTLLEGAMFPNVVSRAGSEWSPPGVRGRDGTAPPPLGLPQGPRHSPSVGSSGGVVSYERGTPVGVHPRSAERLQLSTALCTVGSMV